MYFSKSYFTKSLFTVSDFMGLTCCGKTRLKNLNLARSHKSREIDLFCIAINVTNLYYLDVFLIFYSGDRIRLPLDTL
jgi:hypothetical protein